MPRSLEYMLLGFLCFCLSTYILAYEVEGNDYATLLDDFIFLSTLIGLIVAGGWFITASVHQAVKSEFPVRAIINLVPVVVVGIVLFDGLNRLGNLDEVAYLSALVPVLAAGLVGWFVAARRPTPKTSPSHT